MSLDHAFFYKSVNGDRVYDDASFEHWLKKFFTSGVFLNDLQVTANNDMTVTVGAGYTNIDGKVKIFESETPLIIETAGASYPRIDSIVLERNDTERDILLKVVKGGYSSEPVAHTPVRQDGVYQLVIAQILVNAGAVKVSQADVTDTRSNTELCGFVAGAVDQIDFSQIQAQFDSYLAQYKKQLEEEHAEHNADMDAYLEQMETNLDQMEADFATWFEGVKNQLDEDAAGHLQNQIDDINARLEYAGGSMVEVTVGDSEGEYNVEGLEVNLVIDEKTYTETIKDNVVKFTGVLEVGTAKITCVDETQEFNAETSIDIPYYGAYECSIGNGGGTYKKWIEAGGLNPSSYESLEALLEDETAIRTLMTKKDAVDALAQIRKDDLATIINHRYVAKWVNYREYAYSTLSAISEIKNLMDESGMYGMYITAKSKSEPLVPVLTSNNGSDGGVVSASSTYDDTGAYAPYKAFDGDNSTSWFPSTGDSFGKANICYKFPKPTKVSSVYIESNKHQSGYRLKDFHIDVSNDNEKWETIYNGTFVGEVATGNSYGKTINLSNDSVYLYYRVVVDSTDGANIGAVSINTIQFYGYQEGDTLWEPKGLVPVMTSNTAPYGEAFASSEYSGSYPAWKAFDRINNMFQDAWLSVLGVMPSVSAPQYIGYKSSVPFIVNKVVVANRNSAGDSVGDTALFPIKDVIVQGSNDGSKWDDLKNYTNNVTGSASSWEIQVSSTTPYLYHRLLITSAHDTGHANKFVSVGELQFYGRQLEALIPPMTSNTAPIGEASVEPSDDVYASGHEAYRAFDGDSTTRWAGKDGKTVGKLIYKFAKPTCVKEVLIDDYYITGTSSVQATATLKDFEILASNDNLVWTSIYSGTMPNTETSKNHNLQYFAISNTEQYTYYQLYMKNKHNTNNGYSIWSIQFYGTPDYESRTYIYEHGVEVMGIDVEAKSGTAERLNDNILLSVTTGISASENCPFAKLSSVDMNNYDLVGVCIDKVYYDNAGNANTFSIGSGNTLTNIAWVRLSASTMLPQVYLDCSSATNTDANIYVYAAGDTDGNKISISEWWME